MGRLIFITGGVRSGKSSYAIQLAKGSPSVVFVATALPSDEEMKQRIERHQRERPISWKTVEVLDGKITDKIGCLTGDTVIVDCLTLYVSRRLMEGFDLEGIRSEVDTLLDFIERNFKRAILVSNEVGWGVVPDSQLGRKFSEVIGSINQFIAERADEVFLLISGIPLRVK